ncbi:hypothetical protein D915_006762, partial [Fasciola hepatica]
HQPWGSVEVSGVDVFCRSKIPDIPELAVTYLGPPLSDFEYDFVHERQVIADHDQYLDVKSRLEDRNSKPPAPIDFQSGSENKATVTPKATTRSQTPTQCSSIPSVSLPYTTHSQTIYQSSSPTVAPPVAARQLVVGQILQPCKTDPNVLCEPVINGVTHTTTSTTTRMTLPVKADTHQAEHNPLSIRDFESGPDDPFGSAELKTINDLEELSNVLSSTTTVPQSHVPPTIGGCSTVGIQPTTASSVTQLHTNSLRQRSPSSSRQPSCFYTSTTEPNSLRTDRLLLPPPHSATHAPNRGFPPVDFNHYCVTGPHFVHHAPGNPINMHTLRVMDSNPKQLSSSVPNLETAVNVDRPISVATSSDVHKVYRPIAQKPIGMA